MGDDAVSILTIDWCRYQVNVFERSWQSEHMAELKRGLILKIGQESHIILAWACNPIKLGYVD